MSASVPVDEKISSLEAEIEGYKSQLLALQGPENKDERLSKEALISASRQDLTALRKQQTGSPEKDKALKITYFFPSIEDDEPDVKGTVGFRSQQDLEDFLARVGSAGLISEANPEESIIHFDKLQDNIEYHLKSPKKNKVQSLINWTQNDDKGFEDESTECIKTEGEKKYGKLEPMERKFKIDGKEMEFDGVLKNSSVVFINEAKHNPRSADIDKLVEKVNVVQGALDSGRLPGYEGVKRAIPVISGQFLHPETRYHCNTKNIAHVFPSGKGLIAVRLFCTFLRRWK